MPKLILSMDGLVLKEIALDKERISIGRKPNNDIQIDNLAISGQHALITTILDDSFLEDQNSTNGTYVNGQSVKKCVLHANDVIELGKYRLKFIADDPRRDTMNPGYVGPVAAPPCPAPVRADEVETGRDTRLQPPPDVDHADTSTAVEDAGTGVIDVLTGPNAGRRLPLTKPMITLGKPGKQVAVITRRQHGYFITHVEGESFPEVNGQPVGAQARPLGDGDVIVISGVRMAFRLTPG